MATKRSQDKNEATAIVADNRGPDASAAPPAVPPAEASAPVSYLPERDSKGRFLKGQSGNPAGKRPGTKNFITQQRLALEAALREYMNEPDQKIKVLEAIDKLLTVAQSGEDKDAINAIKLLMEMSMVKPKGEDAGATGPKAVTVIIDNRTDADEKPVEVVIDDVDYEEITHA